MQKGLLGIETGLLWKISVLKGLGENWTFWGENGTFGKNKCVKRTLW